MEEQKAAMDALAAKINKEEDERKELKEEMARQKQAGADIVQSNEAERLAADQLMLKHNEEIASYERLRRAKEEAARTPEPNSTGTGGGLGPSTNPEMQREGGYAGQGLSHVTVPSSLFAGAPHYAQGTPNTSGGIPAILHDNEAVIPLSRNRSIPVEFNKQTPTDFNLNADKNFQMPFDNLAEKMIELNGTVADYIDAMMKQPNASAASLDSKYGVQSAVGIETVPGGTPILPNYQMQTETASGGSSPAPNPHGTVQQRPIQVNMTVNAKDADSFRRTQDQLTRELRGRIERVTRTYG